MEDIKNQRDEKGKDKERDPYNPYILFLILILLILSENALVFIFQRFL